MLLFVGCSTSELAPCYWTRGVVEYIPSPWVPAILLQTWMESQASEFSLP